MEAFGLRRACRSAPDWQSLRTPGRCASSDSLLTRFALRPQSRESARRRHRSTVPVMCRTRPGFSGRTSALFGAEPAQPVPGGDKRGLGAIVGLQLAEDSTDVVADRLLRQAEAQGDLPVAQSAGQRLAHFGFAAG